MSKQLKLFASNCECHAEKYKQKELVLTCIRIQKSREEAKRRHIIAAIKISHRTKIIEDTHVEKNALQLTPEFRKSLTCVQRIKELRIFISGSAKVYIFNNASG